MNDFDEMTTMLDLARVYIDMGDVDGAKDALDEIMKEGNNDQKKAAKTLLQCLAKGLNDETDVKLALARACIGMGDAYGAKDFLGDILKEGNNDQKKEAEMLLRRLFRGLYE